MIASGVLLTDDTDWEEIPRSLPRRAAASRESFLGSLMTNDFTAAASFGRAAPPGPCQTNGTKGAGPGTPAARPTRISTACVKSPSGLRQ